MKKAEIYAKKYLSKEVIEIQRSQQNEELQELTLYEKAIIYKYSNDGYDDLNEKLRINNGKNNGEFGKLLDFTLSKLSNFNGLVYRGANLSKKRN